MLVMRAGFKGQGAGGACGDPQSLGLKLCWRLLQPSLVENQKSRPKHPEEDLR